MSIIQEYFDYHTKYNKIYDNALVMMQVGSFYEAYATTSKGPNLHKISEIINIICTKKDKSISEISIKNPYMLGFPLVVGNKYFKVLVDNNFTIIVINQITNPPNPKREISHIYSPGTFFDDIYKPESNFICCIYIEEVLHNKFPIICCGISAVDVTSGKCYIQEIISKTEDDKYGLDEVNRFLTNLSPKECIAIISCKYKTNKEFISKYLDLDKYLVHYMDIGNCGKLSFQLELLNLVYKNNSTISTIEYLNLNDKIFALIALTGIFNFIMNHNKRLILNVDKPINYFTNDNLILGNNAIYQLNIVDNENMTRDTNYKKCLIDIVNQASTGFGKRFITNRLLSPLINPDELQNIYDTTDIFMENDFWQKIEIILNQIKDIERFKRKMFLKSINPFELNDFIISLDMIDELIKLIKNNNKLTALLPTEKTCKILLKCKKYCKIFDLDRLKQNSLNNIQNNLFIKGVYKDIDELYESIDNEKNNLDKICKDFSKKIGKKILIKDAKNGYYLQLSIQNYQLLKEKCNLSKYSVTTHNKIVKINFQQKNSGEELLLIKTHYLNEIINIYNKYNKLLSKLIKFITQIDYYKTICKVSIENNYIKPTIIKKDYGYINCKQLRHPIVEKIIDVPYVPHDISTDVRGMLIYGINGCGKSILIKSIACNIILAQAGFHVAATHFEYMPYTNIYTRISGQDNLYKGLSSFTLEMIELKAINQRCDNYSLVIGDEICKGTESISATAIVASSLIKLYNTGSTFFFATHLHELVGLNKIKNLKLNVRHLAVIHDSVGDKLIYSRKLQEGAGECIYGITVCKYIMGDKNFMSCVEEIKDELMDIKPIHQSKYNPDLYIYECKICGNNKSLHTHHINFQKNCHNNYVIGKNAIHKNSIQNLIVLCESCHDKIHKGEIILNDYINTSSGKSIDIYFDNQV